LGAAHGNIPSIDLANGLVVSGCLDGNISVMPVCNKDTLQTPPLAPPEESGPTRTSRSVFQEPLDDYHLLARDPDRARANAVRWLGEGIWNASWIPIHSISTVSPRPVNDGKVGMSNVRSRVSVGQGICWSVASSILSEELVTDWILPFLSASDLLKHVQGLSNASATLAHATVRSARRRERVILCLSGRRVWLLDSGLKIHCRKQLPFDATFAHACYAAELSTLFVAAKYDSNHQVWAVTVLRRHCSLRYQLQIHRVPVMTQGPRVMLVGMAVSKRRLFTLTAGRRLSCYRMDLQLEEGHEEGMVDF